VGPVYTEEFMHIWLGEDIDVKEAEKKIKLNFKSRISSAEAGLSEWICDINKQEILDFIDELRTDYFIKLQDGPVELQPLTMNNCEDLQDWYDENFITE